MADEVAREIIESALKELIDTKHLYQAVTVDFRKDVVREAVTQLTYAKRVADQAKNPAPTLEEIEGQLSAEMARRNWSIGYPIQNSIMIMVPPVRTLCGNCKDVEPFNLRNGLPSAHTFSGLEAGAQVFCLELECQRCRKNVIVFELRKNADKIQIVGRSEFEEVAVPPVILKNVGRFYSEAVIALQCKAVLASIFLLRTLIEQHMRSVTKASGEVRGDDLCDRYAETLPDDFKKRFPSLKEIYGKLSEAMHQAKDDLELFESQSKEIVTHFEALRLFKLHQ
jgi:hypothetical protein